MLLGPTGCGKSTLLAELARAAITAPTPTPVVFMRLRVSSRKRRGTDLDAQSGKDLMDSVAAGLCEQIGYPSRPSIIGGFFARGFTFHGKFSQAELAAPDSAPRLIRALRLLFSVCAELRNERAAAGMSALDAAPILLFDEVQDLLKDERLKAIGGEDVFDALATLIVVHCVDRLDVRAIVAGSSAELYFAFSDTVARGNRWRYFELADPAPDVVVAALVKRKYAEADARAMVALCGTRLRLLAGPLALGAATLDAATFLREAADVGRAAFVDIFKKLEKPHAAELARILDGVAACGASDALAGETLRVRARPKKESLPDSVRALEIAPILYVDRASGLFFQSALHANAWAGLRGEYVTRGKEMA
jgi:energy-coupling factor transporter ATP-binding protein EcfA2